MQIMFPVKVKVEKSELEMAKDGNQLGAVLQSLLEKKHTDRDQLGEETGSPKILTARIAPSRPLAKTFCPLSPPAEEEEEGEDCGLAEGVLRDPTHNVIELVDQSVDLAQVSENTQLTALPPSAEPGYATAPLVREPERSASSLLPPLPDDEEGSEVTSSKSQDVCKLPPPTASADLEFHPHCSPRPRARLMMRPFCPCRPLSRNLLPSHPSDSEGEGRCC